MEETSLTPETEFDLEQQAFEQETGCALPRRADAASPERPAPKRGRLLVNLAANFASFAVSLLIGIWLTPYLIRNLGTACYGIIPLVTQITSYFAVVTIVLNSAVSRYLMISLEQGDTEEANRYFNTSLFGSVLLAVGLLVPTVLATVFLDRLILLPVGQETQTRWLFACAVGAFYLSTIQSAFSVSTFYMNRFDLWNMMNVLQQVARVAALVALFTLFKPELMYVGLATLLCGFIGWGWSVRWWRRLTPMLYISISHFNPRTLKNLVSMGGWMSINYVGSLLFLAIDLLVVNRMFGPEAGGRYAAALQWSTLLRTIAMVAAGVFAPTILYHYAHQNIDGLTVYCRRAVKIVGLLTALPIGLVCGLAYPLLGAWLGPDFTDLSWLLCLLTLHMAISLPQFPLYSIFTAVNRVRVPAVVTVVLGVCNLGLAIFLAGPMGWGLYGVAAAGTGVLLLKNTLFVPVYAALVLGRKPLALLTEVLPIAGAAALVVAGGVGCQLLWDVHGWWRLIAVGAGLSIAYVAVAYFLFLNRAERILAWQTVPGLNRRPAIDGADEIPPEPPT